MYNSVGAINGTSTGMTNVLEVLDLESDTTAPLGIGMTVTAINQTMQNEPEPLWDPNYVRQGDSVGCIILYGFSFFWSIDQNQNGNRMESMIPNFDMVYYRLSCMEDGLEGILLSTVIR